MNAATKQQIKMFVERWQVAEGNEQRESNSFWIELAGLLGIQQPTHVLDFERKVRGRRIDVFYEDMGILIENKSRGVDLDKAYERGKDDGGDKRMVTPYEQAKWYADNLPHSISPRWVIVCNFDEIRIHDLDLENPGSDYVSLLLDELPDHLHLLGMFTDDRQSRLVKEKELSVQAGELVGKLYSAFAEQYKSIDTDEREQHSLNVLIVRLVFLLYAEDAGLLQEHQAFCKYMRKIPESQMRGALLELFRVLDTPESERDPYLSDDLAAFPYINGGLFADEDIIVPNFTLQLKTDLLLNASQEFDWKGISPTIFGAAFESTLNPETRRSGGMHYTSIENIHKVIDPLFLNDLKAELAAIEGEKMEKKRIIKLRQFQKKLSELTFLDPAAGSHNFLTETYISLRKLELRIIEDLRGDQTSFMDAFENSIMVNIGQFYAIEINDFAVSVGKTALWIAEQQMLEATQELLPYQDFDFLPLKSITNSVCANALCIDWNDVLPAEKCNYIMGNPPFLGYTFQTGKQKEDVVNVFQETSVSKKIDYVACWYKKALDYVVNDATRIALVSTNSICQGEQVPDLWKCLLELGIVIDYAYKTFVWNNEATNQAHVHVVIIGFHKGSSSGTCRLYVDQEVIAAKCINPYLVSAPIVLIESRSKPLSDVPPINKGSQPTDGGHLIVKTQEERDELLRREPNLEPYLRRYMGSDEFINNKYRWCFWLKDIPTIQFQNSNELMKRLAAVRDMRLASTKKQTRDAASTPFLFTEIRQPISNYILVPRVSSERRSYIPIGFVVPDVIASDSAQVIPDATLYHFGVLTSQFHNAWMRTVAGRLKSDYRYSNKIVYNNFIWPNPTDEQRTTIETCAQSVLDARDNYPDKCLADLYDPDKMPADLLAAHKALDAAVEAAYGGGDFHGDEEKIVAHLFKLYAEATKNE